jgi:hypothetical protein
VSCVVGVGVGVESSVFEELFVEELVLDVEESVEDD